MNQISTMCALLRTVALFALAALLMGCSSTWSVTADPTHDAIIRAEDEFQYRVEERRKRAKQHESICFSNAAMRSLDLFYNLFTLQRPQLLLPRLERDFLMNVVETSDLYPDKPALRKALVGPVNDALNHRLDEINAGTYNTIYVRVSLMHYVGVTPLLFPLTTASAEFDESQSEDLVMVWISEPLGRAMLRGVLERTHMDRLAVVDRSGSFIVARNDAIGVDPLAMALGTDSSSRFTDFVEPQPQYPARCTSRVEQ